MAKIQVTLNATFSSVAELLIMHSIQNVYIYNLQCQLFPLKSFEKFQLEREENDLNEQRSPILYRKNLKAFVCPLTPLGNHFDNNVPSNPIFNFRFVESKS